MAFSKRRSSIMLHLMTLFLTGREGRKEVRKEGKGMGGEDSEADKGWAC
jgi:hypothetical protein